MLHPEKRSTPILLLRRLVPGVGLAMLQNVPIRGDKETARPGCGILNHVLNGGFQYFDDRVNQWSGREVLTCSRFLFVRVLFEKAFVKVA